MSPRTGSISRPRTGLLALGLTALLVAGCGSAADDSGADSEAVDDRGRLVRVFYAWESGGEWGRIELDVIAQGRHRSRTEAAIYSGRTSPDETVVIVRDGNRAMFFSEQAETTYTVMEAADEQPEEFFVQSLPLDPDSADFRDLCPDARHTAPRTILGRTALGYTCTREDPEPDRSRAGSIWLDEATGMILEHGEVKAREVEDDPDVDATTFSTTPPDGADVEVVKATGKGPPAPEVNPEVNPEDALGAIADASATPVYYLGPEFEGVPLSDVAVFDRSAGSEVIGDLSVGPDQSLTIFYGDSLEIQQDRFRPERYRRAAGCRRLEPLRGVPAVQQSDAVWLFSDDLVIRIGSLTDAARAVPVAGALREVGTGPSPGNLPPPPARNLALVDRACGAEPGQHGPPIED